MNDYLSEGSKRSLTIWGVVVILFAVFSLYLSISSFLQDNFFDNIIGVVAAILFFFFCVTIYYTFRRNIRLAGTFMMISGILSLPIGIFLIIGSISLKAYYKKDGLNYIKGIQDETALKDVVIGGSGIFMKMQALERISREELFEEILKKSGDSKIRQYSIKRITNQELLGKLANKSNALNSYDAKLRLEELKNQ